MRYGYTAAKNVDLHDRIPIAVYSGMFQVFFYGCTNSSATYNTLGPQACPLSNVPHAAHTRCRLDGRADKGCINIIGSLPTSVPAESRPDQSVFVAGNT